MGLDIKTLAVAKKIMSNGTSNNNISSSDINGNIKINGVETSVYTHPEGTNPHGTTKEDIGLGSVENKKIDDQTPNFEISNTRENIFGGEKLSVILGKIKKYFSDLKSVAFSGNYNDLNDKPALKTVATSGSYNDLNDKPTMRIINKDHIIKNLTNISQINEIGFWSINAIEQSYAEQIALDRNTGDFHAICCNYNGNGIDRFDFGNLLLFSPRFGTSYYYINVWEGNATAIKSVLKSNLLNTIEQISANTSTDNVCSALALKAAMADYTNKFNQLNSDLSGAKGIRLFTQYISAMSTDENGNIYYDFVSADDLPQYSSPIVQNSYYTYAKTQVLGTRNIAKNTIRIYFSNNAAPTTVSILYKVKL